MGNIKFCKEKYTVPFGLELDVDGVNVEYEMIESGIRFLVWFCKPEKAMDVVKEVVENIILERSEPQHGVSYRTTSLDMIKCNEQHEYTIIEWKYRVRDSY